MTTRNGNETSNDESSQGSLLDDLTTIKTTRQASNDKHSVGKVKSEKGQPRQHVSNDASDDDDEDFLGEGPTFTKKHTGKRNRTDEKEAKKAAAAERKRQEREDKRREREAKKLAEQKSKKDRLQQAQQAMGKFSKKEIVVLVEPQLFNEKNCKDSIVEPLKKEYMVQEHDVGMGGHAIQWIRKDHLSGGAKDAMKALVQGHHSEYQHLDRLAILFYDPKRFLKLLERSVDNDDYPNLERWLHKILRSWTKSSSIKKQPRIVLLLHQVTDQVDKEWNEHRRIPKTPAPICHAELHDAITWLLIQHQVECIHCASLSVVCETLHKMTRALCENPYKLQVTELECISKIKAATSTTDSEYERAKDRWIRQLQQVPRVSETKAMNLASVYPTCSSLWEQYQDDDLSEEEKRLLVANHLSEGRQEVKLSDSIYQLLTSTNPKQMLS